MTAKRTSANGTRTPMREHAVKLAKMGFRVFRLIENQKVPAVKTFFKVASSDPIRVSSMWKNMRNEELNNNIGALMGNGILAIDVDVKNGMGGLASLNALKIRGLDTNTLTVITPSGGRHLFYHTPVDAYPQNSVGKLGEGIDVRGEHGYVVGAGSIIDDKDYSFVEPTTPILDAPDWLLQMIGEAKPRPASSVPLVELDLPESLERAKQYLSNVAPEALEGAGGDHTTFAVACRVMDFGVSELETLLLMWEHWNETKTKRVAWTKKLHAELRKHSKARTPVAKISKQMKRTVGALRQQALKLGIGLGHQR